MIRDTTPDDFPTIVALNLECEEYLDPLPLEKLLRLAPIAAHFKVSVRKDEVVGFLLAFGDDARYNYPAYTWFTRHRKNFLYVDRVAVGAEHRKFGVASALYRDLISCARDQARSAITCEFDITPPNPTSELFHRRFGFCEIDRIPVQGGKKQVSLQELIL